MLELAELGCTGASWPGPPFSGKSVCSSPNYLLQTLDAFADETRVNFP